MSTPDQSPSGADTFNPEVSREVARAVLPVLAKYASTDGWYEAFLERGDVILDELSIRDLPEPVKEAILEAGGQELLDQRMKPGLEVYTEDIQSDKYPEIEFFVDVGTGGVSVNSQFHIVGDHTLDQVAMAFNHFLALREELTSEGYTVTYTGIDPDDAAMSEWYRVNFEKDRDLSDPEVARNEVETVMALIGAQLRSVEESLR